ncbi:MAG: glycosyl hydrolase [Bacteroidetes bacterium]|nr:glycosyl hydrolase [Bacteroidota bacterium]
MMNKVYTKILFATNVIGLYLFGVALAVLFSINSASAQQVFPGGGAGSYNLTKWPAPPYTLVAPVNQKNWYLPMANGAAGLARKGATYKGPFQANNWWNSAFWRTTSRENPPEAGDVTSNHMYPYPLMMQMAGDGMQFGYRTIDQQAENPDPNQNPPAEKAGGNARLSTCAFDLKLNFANPADYNAQAIKATSAVIADYGDWHVKFEQHFGPNTTLYTTAAAGSPFVFFDYQSTAGLVPTFDRVWGGAQFRILAVNNNSILVNIFPSGLPSNPKGNPLNPEGFYAFYFPEGTQLAGNDGAFRAIANWGKNNELTPLRIKLPDGKTQFTLAIMPDSTVSTFHLYEPYAYCAITDTRFTYSYDVSKSKVTNTFTVTTTPYDNHGDSGTITALYRHQYLYSPEVTTHGIGKSYFGAHGEMKIIKGHGFRDIMTYYGNCPELGKAAKNFNKAKISQLITNLFAFSQFTDYKGANYDDYNFFRATAFWGQSAEIAHQIGRDDLRDKLLDQAKIILEDFMTSPNNDTLYTVYDPQFNFMVTLPNGFFSAVGQYDYHFLACYMIYSAAMIGKFELQRSGNLDWVNKYKPMIDLMVRNINDWNRDMVAPSNPNDPWFPYLRYFDPYAGHSWFSHSTVAQEAVSEAVLFATGAMMWGDLTDNIPMRDMGTMLYVTESEAGRQYWFDYDNVGLNKGPFAPDYPSRHAGIVWEDGSSYGNFFDPHHYAIMRGALMPITGSSVWLGSDRAAVKGNIDDLLAKEALDYITQPTWTGEVLAYAALDDANGARKKYDNNIFNGLPPKQSLDGLVYPVIHEHWMATLDSVGYYDGKQVQADFPFFSVFRKDTCNTWIRHYMMYNAPGPNHPARTVKFTDGTCWHLPQDTLIVYKLMGPDSVKSITATGGACENDVINIDVDADICPMRDPSMYYEYSKDKVHWNTLYNVKTASDSLHVKFTPTTAGTYYFRAIMLGEDVPGLLCPLRDTTDNIAEVTVSSCCPLKIDTVKITKATCSGRADGKIIIEASNGAAPYQYSIDNGITLTASNNFNNLKADTFYVYVKDANNCVKRREVIVGEASSINVVKKDSVNVKCFGDTSASATIEVSGGTAPYTYLWDDAALQSTPTAHGLTGRLYIVKVSDQNGCFINVSFDLPEPAQLNISSIDITKVNCFGDSTGALKANVAGGISPYEFLWSNADTLDSITSLPIGVYKLQVSDAKGCKAISQAEVKSPALLELKIDKSSDNCFGGNNQGALSAKVSGGVAAYTYQWDVPGSGNVSSLNNLPSGEYHLIVTDGNGCSVSDSTTILQSAPLDYTVNVVNPSCGNADGTASIVVNVGGSVPYVYQWDARAANQTTATANNLNTGWYLFTITDGAGCSKTDSIELQNLNGVAFVDKEITNPTCFGKCDGSLMAVAAGGTRPYKYQWDSIASVDSFATGLCAGNYLLTVTDVNKCSDVISFVLDDQAKNPPFANFSFSPQEVSLLEPTVYFTNLSTDASIFKWTFGNGDSSFATQPVYTYADTGFYSVCLRASNENNCFMDTCGRVQVEGISVFYVPNAFTPGSDGKNDLFMPVTSGLDPDSYQLNIFNRWGELFFSTNDLNKGWDGTRNGRPVQVDVYVWKIDFKEKDSKKLHSKIGHVTLLR